VVGLGIVNTDSRAVQNGGTERLSAGLARAGLAAEAVFSAAAQVRQNAEHALRKALAPNRCRRGR
jgi:hypothetical protein